ncbi:hypothetical protein [Rhodoferax sp. GW822-FHT02A01]|uniref:hypothetical protein n=1 Tax=Rhodoferax sp. GW822-FHT02A01 TaxID=3141537 RepID=UPI00315DDA1C
MTLLEEIKAKCPADVLASHDTQAIATAVSTGRVRVISVLGGIGTVMEALGPTAGAALLDSLTTLATTNSAVKWGMVLINRGDFDFGSVAGRGMIDALVTDKTQASALKAVAEIADPITAQDVRLVCQDYDGNWVV